MWLQSYVLLLAFLLSVVSGRKDEQPIKYIPVYMDVFCNGRAYTKRDLDTAAKEACSRTSRQTFCRDSIGPYYLKQCIPAIRKASLYKGSYYSDQATDGPLLQWPLPKTTFLERNKYYAIIYWNEDARLCKVVGAIEQTKKTEYVPCVSNKYKVAENVNLERSLTQRKKDLQHTRMNPTDMSPGGNQNKISPPTQPSDTQPKLKSEKLNLVRKFQQVTPKNWRKHSGNSNNIVPTDSKT